MSYQKIRKPVICIDFDGVIANYDEGWRGENVFGDPIPFASETIQKLKSDGWYIVIFTTRQETKELREYLSKNNIPYDAINSIEHNPPNTSIKPFFDMILDDRTPHTYGKKWNWKKIYKLIRKHYPPWF